MLKFKGKVLACICAIVFIALNTISVGAQTDGVQTDEDNAGINESIYGIVDTGFRPEIPENNNQSSGTVNLPQSYDPRLTD